MKEKKYKWHKIAETPSELPFAPNNLLEMEVAGKRICLARGLTLHACAAKCPHAGGTMAEGFLNDTGIITCPLHRYKFSLENGRNTSGEGYYLKTYPVKVEAGGVFVGIEEGGFLSWLK